MQNLYCKSVTLKAEQKACIKSVQLPTGYSEYFCHKVLPFVLVDKLDRQDSLVVVVSLLVYLIKSEHTCI